MAAPLWVIKSICMPYGARLPKAPEPFKKARGVSFPGNWNGPGRFRQLPAGFTSRDYRQLPGLYCGDDDTGPTWNLTNPSPTAEIIKGKVAKGNLSNEMYEFFGGAAWEDSDRSVCRACGDMFYRKESVKEHFSRTECSQLVKKIATFLRRDKVCVICDARTIRCTWGFPLCSKECVARFKFWAGRMGPKAFEEAKTLILRERWRLQ